MDVEQHDIGAGADFYAALFGWTFAEAGRPGADRPYLFAQLDGEDVGALEGGDSGAGWVSYISCDDIEQACVSVERAGGIVGVPPTDGAPYGRSATCADPQGAIFRLWEPQSHPGSQIVNVPGTWNFSDLHTPDPEASLAFYGEVFGWRVDPGLGAGMIRLPGYGDHLAATSDPDIHERQAFAPPGFADVIAGLTPDTSALLGDPLHGGRPRRQRGARRAARRDGGVPRGHRVDQGGRHRRPAGRATHRESVRTTGGVDRRAIPRTGDPPRTGRDRRDSPVLGGSPVPRRSTNAGRRAASVKERPGVRSARRVTR